MLKSTLSSWRELREYLTPISHTSTFSTTGEITPEEFVQAGDFLVYKFPTWQWESAPPNKQRDFLPADKQVLTTKHVPSHIRATSMTSMEPVLDGGEDADEEDEESEWIPRQHASAVANHKAAGESGASAGPDSAGEIEEIVEIEEEDDDAAVFSKPTSSSDPNLRSYNIYITYSTSYRVPKVYLSGFNADGVPLLPEQMYEDVVGDYKDKTVTLERAPFAEDLTMISVHPCKHSNVMRILLKKASDKLADEWEEVEQTTEATEDNDNVPDSAIRVDQYLIIFLKFISSVIPGIEYDYTMEF